MNSPKMASLTDWLEVATIHKAHFLAYVREYPHKIWPSMVQYLHFRILKFPLKWGNDMEWIHMGVSENAG